MIEPSAVFVDPTGRRRSTIRAAAIVGAALLLSIVALLVAAVLGVPIEPLTSLPKPGAGPAPAVEQGARAPVVEPIQLTVPRSSAHRPDSRTNALTAAITSTTPDPTPTTTAAPGMRPDSAPGRSDSAPGRPTDLPTPPGHTR